VAVVVAPITQKPAQVEQVVTSLLVSTQVDKPIVANDCDLTSNYDWPKQTAYGICMAESKGNTNAIGDNYPINGLHAVSCGLMQIRSLQGRPTCLQLQNPQVNMDYAYNMWKGQGFKPWSTYNNGQYKKFL